MPGMHYAVSASLLVFLSQHALVRCCRKPVLEFIKEIQKLTPEDIGKLVTKMLKSPPTVATLGDVASVPRYDAIASRFR